MRRRAVTAVNILDVDRINAKSPWKKRRYAARYQISREGLAAILDYIQKERGIMMKSGKHGGISFTLSNPHGNGRLTVKVIN